MMVTGFQKRSAYRIAFKRDMNLQYMPSLASAEEQTLLVQIFRNKNAHCRFQQYRDVNMQYMASLASAEEQTGTAWPAWSAQRGT